ncbi:MAG: T9SS type A sorting domain-containing protein [Bacteroidetes bacterium]|nr:MAG: T9SS type A sorting domain-containing protein [Bacteroidota bacterium]
MLRNVLFTIGLISSSLSFGQQVAGGNSHTLFLCPDGKVMSTGSNIYGQLGHSNNEEKRIPEFIPAISDIAMVAAGAYHSLFLKTDGTVWACGSNDFGELGNGNRTSYYSPVQILNISNVVAIAAGSYHSLFLKNDGTVWACGRNSEGQLGQGNTTDSWMPIQIPGLTGITAIDGGSEHSLFLKSDSTVWSCGLNNSGQTGHASTLLSAEIPGLKGVKSISAGDYHSLFLLGDGTVRACGDNLFNQIGLSGHENVTVQQNLGLAQIKEIAAGGRHSIYLKTDGTAIGCGYNFFGTTGSGKVSILSELDQVKGVSNVSAIAATGFHSFFVKADKTILGCGWNNSGALGNGGYIHISVPVQIATICAPPQPPTVNMSDFPTSVCLGSNLQVSPSISGSNPEFALYVDNSIQVTNPKAITKNSHSVFVLNDNDAIIRFDFDGNVTSSYPNLNISGIQAFAADDSSHVYLFNGDGNFYKCDSTGTLLETISVLWAAGSANQLVYSTPVASSLYPSNLFLVDAQQSLGVTISGVNTHDSDPFNNSTLYQGNTFPEPLATSMSIDNFYGNKRALLADPTNSTLHSRMLYFPTSGANPDFKEEFLVDSASTAGMALDFINADTVFNAFTVSSKTTGILGFGASYKNADGTVTSFIDTSLTSQINPTQPVGIMLTPLGSAFQIWVADRGQNRIIRAYGTSYEIKPKLPQGLVYNPNTGEVSGTPVKASAPQAYQVKLTTPYGTDSSTFTFGVSTPSGVKNAAGTGSSDGQQKDGLTIKYYDANNCEKLIDIADSLGGTAPGYTRVSQTVYPVVSVIANDQLIRRATQIEAENIDTLQVNVTFYYTYDDIQLYKQSTGSSISNDTASGTMQMAVLQMHELPNGGREPIIHSPITAEWVSADQNWKAVVPVTKFSEFYAGDMSTIENFECTNDTSISMTVNASFYVWNYDSLFVSDVYTDTLINTTGCDSVVTLDLTLKPNGVHESDLASGIYIYPNPSKGVFNVKFAQEATEFRTVRVTNLQGQEVYRANLSSGSTIDLSNQSNGVYFINIESEDQRPFVMRVVKW